MKRIIFVFLVSIVCFLISASFAHADDDFALALYPPLIEINAEAPSNAETKITIQNKSENKEDLDIVYKPFKLKKGGQIEYPAEGKPQGEDRLIFDKVKIYDGDLAIQTLSLNPFESKDLVLKILLPPLEPSGDYYFSILFVSKGGIGQQSSSVSSGGIGTNVILSVGGNSQATGYIGDFSTPFFVENGPVEFKLLINNTSKYYVTPRGRIVIRDMLGKDAGFVTLLSRPILADSSRYMVDSQAYRSAPSFEREVVSWHQKFLFGIYTATAVVNLSASGPTFERSISFVALPLYLIFALSFIAFIILGIYIRVRRKI